MLTRRRRRMIEEENRRYALKLEAHERWRNERLEEFRWRGIERPPIEYYGGGGEYRSERAEGNADIFALHLRDRFPSLRGPYRIQERSFSWEKRFHLVALGEGWHVTQRYPCCGDEPEYEARLEALH